jgi:hypothetical protein
MRNKVSTINDVFFSLLSSSPDVTFLPEGVIVGFRNFAWDFKSQLNPIWGEKKNWGSPHFPSGGGGDDFLFIFQKKKRKALRIAPPQALVLKNFR